VVAHRRPDDIAKRLGEYLSAGASHVAILVLGGQEKVLPASSELAGPLYLSRYGSHRHLAARRDDAAMNRPT
jgi:hypothetical protein